MAFTLFDLFLAGSTAWFLYYLWSGEQKVQAAGTFVDSTTDVDIRNAPQVAGGTGLYIFSN